MQPATYVAIQEQIGTVGDSGPKLIRQAPNPMASGNQPEIFCSEEVFAVKDSPCRLQLS